MSQIHLSRKLVLEDPARTPDGSGGFAPGWVPLGQLWAEVKAGSGRELTGLTAPVATVTYRITVRAAPAGAMSRPKPEQRFREGERVFHILAVSERDPAGRFLTCHAQEERSA